VPTARPDMTFHVSEASARHLRDLMDNVRVIVSGRRLFDVAHGWAGRHPFGVPVYVVTHSVPDGWPREDAPFTFVTDGVESAIAQAKATAGDGIVAVGGANIAQQCLEAGLLDGIGVALVPVLLGKGIRFFDNLAKTPVFLEDPEVIEGVGVTHLYYRVRKP
jgi:dihydrofolate reductase